VQLQELVPGAVLVGGSAAALHVPGKIILGGIETGVRRTWRTQTGMSGQASVLLGGAAEGLLDPAKHPGLVDRRAPGDHLFDRLMFSV
jgi:hypothetical protein